MEQQKRHVAYKVSILSLLQGPYVQHEGLQPNAVMIGNLAVSRVNSIGIVVNKEEGETIKTLLLDDGTGSIELRIFDDASFQYAIGDIINVIGKPRESGLRLRFIEEVSTESTEKRPLIKKNVKLVYGPDHFEPAELAEALVREWRKNVHGPPNFCVVDDRKSFEAGRGQSAVDRFNELIQLGWQTNRIHRDRADRQSFGQSLHIEPVALKERAEHTKTRWQPMNTLPWFPVFSLRPVLESVEDFGNVFNQVLEAFHPRRLVCGLRLRIAPA